VSSTRDVGSWLARRIEPRDLLFPYAVPFLRALPEARKAKSLPRGDARTLLATIGAPRAVPELWITLPVGPRDRLRPDELQTLRRTYDVTLFPNWVVIRVPGPFTGRAGLVAALDHAVDTAYRAIAAGDPISSGYKLITRSVVDEAERREHDTTSG
jgi:hypothetical protein